jgi:Arc/MetJ-type ribon-helix-helix transcriptional regulator
MTDAATRQRAQTLDSCPCCGARVPDRHEHLEFHCEAVTYDDDVDVRFSYADFETIQDAVAPDQYRSVAAVIRAACRNGLPTDRDGAVDTTATSFGASIESETVETIEAAVEVDAFADKSHAIRAALRELLEVDR